MESPVSLSETISTGYRTAFPTVLVSSLGGIAAGLALSGMEAEFRAVPGLLVMIPAFLAIRGSVYGSLGSRLSSGLHQGLIEPTFDLDRRVWNALAAALLNGITTSLLAAALTFGILTALGSSVASLPVLLAVAFLGGTLAGIALSGVVLLVVFVGYRRGSDPDNLVGPTVTTAGDVFGTLSLLVATRLVVWIAAVP